MNRPLRVLLVEDDERDAALVVLELKRGGFDVTSQRVDTREAFERALRESWDAIVSDYSLPNFSGPVALSVVRQRMLDIPFIIVSGTVREETAVDAIRAGAHDFMPKGSLARLCPAIERESREAALRSERAKMEKQLLISERMASVGTLAAGVAHEINNPLAALMLNLDLASQDVVRLAVDIATPSTAEESGGHDTRGAWAAARLREVDELLRDAREAADRVRNIVRDLKLFSRSDEETLDDVDVRRIMDSSIRMAWNELRHRARLVKDYSEVAPIRANESRLGQVFLNLLVNAAQAIPEGNATKNEVRIVARQRDPDHVLVEVTDTGSGIPQEHLSKIFDPFFTTRPIGVGTGLGLAICHRIVAATGGTLEVDSAPGQGTTMRVVFPVAGDPLPDKRQRALPSIAGRRGKILVVDDEASIGVAVTRILASEHDVSATTKAAEALARVQSGERFDAILCDLMMPEMTGMDLHAEVSKVDPEQAARMVFMTGGEFTFRAREFMNDVVNARVEKPFVVAALRTVLDGVLR